MSLKANILLKFNNLDEVGKWCRENLFEYKIIIVENHKQGSLIVDTLVKLGYNSLNLYYKTIEEMVKESINYKLVEGEYIYISYIQCIYEMEKLLIELKEKDKLGYFKDIRVNQDVAKTFYDTYKDLNLEGITDILTLIDKEKIDSIQSIFDRYSQKLEDKKYADKVKLYKTALSCDELDYGDYKYYIELTNNTISKVEREIKSKYTNQNSDVYELNIDICNLESLKNDKNKKTIKYFSAQGESNELYEVIRRIKKENIPFEDVAIYYTDNKYRQMMYELSQSMDINVCFSEGISINNSPQAKLIYSIIAWIKSNYEVTKLFNILNYISVKEITKKRNKNTQYKLSKSKIKSILLELNILRGRETYCNILKKEIKRITKEIKTNKNKEKEKKLSELKEVLDFMNELFEYIPEQKLCYKNLKKYIIEFIKKYSIKNERNILIRTSSINIIEDLFKEFENIDDEIEVIDMLESIEKHLREKNILSQREYGAAIYFINCKNGYWINRKHNFIVGLDNKKLPKNVSENPLILDYEKELINSKGYNLELVKDCQNKEIEEMKKVITSREENITLSYSSFDTVENKPISSSYLFLQIVRMVEGKEDIKYEELVNVIGNPKGTIPSTLDESITIEEQWLYQLIQDGKVASGEIVAEKHRECSGIKEATQAKSRDDLSIYEGKVDKDNLAPINNEDNIISTTKLTTFVSCPYKYFLKYILAVKEDKYKPQELEAWIDKKELGNIVHEVFEKFYKELKEDKIKIKNSKNNIKGQISFSDIYTELKLEDYMDKIENILEKVTNEYKNKKPPISHHSYEQQVLNLNKLCTKFVEEELKSGMNLPQELEYEFGRKDKQCAEIKVGKNKIYINGIVDRLDKSDNKYQIIDYKTGKLDKYKDNSFCKGKHIQNMIYALSLENLLPHTKGNITRSDYYFTSDKGNFKKIGIDINQDNKDKCIEILSDIIELMSEGIFIKDCNEKNNSECKYCGYETICKYEKDIKKQKEKLERIKRDLIEKWKEEGKEGLAFYEYKG